MLAAAAIDHADRLVGVVLLVAAVIGGRRRPDSHVGLIVALSCICWFAGDVWPVLLYAHRAPLVALLLTYPALVGRRDPDLSAAVVVVLAAAMAAGPVARSPWATGAASLVLIGLAAVRARVSFGTVRRARVTALAGAVAIAAVLLASAWNRAAEGGLTEAISWAYLLVVAAVVGALVIDLLRRRWIEAVATSLITDLGGNGRRGTLTGLLADVIGDPDLVVVFDAGDETNEFVDESGRRLSVDLGTPDRFVRSIHDGDRQVAVLLHHRANPIEPALAHAVDAAVRLWVSNARLHADAQGQVAELDASRRRLVEAADGQQRRIRAELQSSVVPCIDAATTVFADMAAVVDHTVVPLLEEITQRLRAATLELDELARGLPPRVLIEQGLEHALRALIDGLPLKHRLSVEVPPLPPATEAAVYFLCAEALTNVVKHAGANHVRVDAATSDGVVEIRIADDGRGGTELGGGSGLRGVADRVAALGGRLSVRSSPGSGTELAASLPITSA